MSSLGLPGPLCQDLARAAHVQDGCPAGSGCQADGVLQAAAAFRLGCCWLRWCRNHHWKQGHEVLNCP